MDWANERYVRLYTRDTVTWRMWPWEARAFFPLLMRKVDRAGVLDIGEHDPEDALSVLLDLPRDIVEAAWSAVTACGAVEARGQSVVIPNFLAAQETAQSDRARAAAARERRRAEARGEPPLVTPSHAASRDVTPSHSSQAYPSQPSRAEAEPAYPEVRLVQSGGYDAGDPVLSAINAATCSCLSADQHGKLYTSAAERVREQDCTVGEVEAVLRAWAVDDKGRRPRQRGLFYAKQWPFTKQRYLDTSAPEESHGEATQRPEEPAEQRPPVAHEIVADLTRRFTGRHGGEQ